MTDMDKLIAIMEKETKKQTYIAYAGLAISLLILYFNYKEAKSNQY